MTEQMKFPTPLRSSNPTVQASNDAWEKLSKAQPGTPEWKAAFEGTWKASEALQKDPEAARTARYNGAKQLRARAEGGDEAVQKLIPYLDRGLLPCGFMGVLSVETGQRVPRDQVEKLLAGPKLPTAY